MQCGVLDGCYEKWSPFPHVQLTGVAKKCSVCSWPIVYGGQEITQEKDLCIAAVAVVAPVKVVAPFAVVATIALNSMVFTSGSCYQLWSGSVVTKTCEVVLPSPQQRNRPSWITSKAIRHQKITMTKVIVRRKNYNDKGNIYICHRFPHPFLIARLKSNVHKYVHKTSIWQRKRFCS